jgi:hypothetical protein
MRIGSYSVEWMEKGVRPNYDRKPFFALLRNHYTDRWFAFWIGGRIRIGRGA